MLLRQYESMLSIQSCRYMKNIWPWRQKNLYIPEWVFYWNSMSGGCIEINSNVISMTPDKFYIIPGHTYYSTFAKNPFEHFHIHFRLNEWVKPHKDIIILDKNEEDLEIIKEFIKISEHPSMVMRETLCAYRVLSSTLLRLPPETLLLANKFDLRIEKVCDLIRRNPQKHYCNDELAQHINMARNSFLQLFRREIGETPQRYSRRKKIEHACKLLHFSNYTIEEIAEQCGFSDRYHFTRIFHLTAGIPPAVFRDKASHYNKLS